MYAIEAQITQTDDRLRPSDLLSQAEGPDADTGRPPGEVSAFERELAAALDEILAEEKGVATPNKESEDGGRTPPDVAVSAAVGDGSRSAEGSGKSEAAANGDRLSAGERGEARKPGGAKDSDKTGKVAPAVRAGGLDLSPLTVSDVLLAVIRADGPRHDPGKTDAKTAGASMGAGGESTGESAKAGKGTSGSGPKETTLEYPATKRRAGKGGDLDFSSKGEKSTGTSVKAEGGTAESGVPDTARAGEAQSAAGETAVPPESLPYLEAAEATLPAERPEHNAGGNTPASTAKSGGVRREAEKRESKHEPQELGRDSKNKLGVIHDREFASATARSNEADAGEGRNTHQRHEPRTDARDSAEVGVELEVQDHRTDRPETIESLDGRAARSASVESFAEIDSRGTGRAPSSSQSVGRAVLDNLSRDVRESIGPDIVRSARIVLRNNDSGEIRLSLHPEELGRVRIRLQMQDNTLMGRIVVDNAAVREVFEQNLPQLLRSFQESGWNTGSLDVSVSDDGADGRRDDAQPSSGARRTQTDDIIEARYSVEERGLVDVMA